VQGHADLAFALKQVNGAGVVAPALAQHLDGDTLMRARVLAAIDAPKTTRGNLVVDQVVAEDQSGNLALLDLLALQRRQNALAHQEREQLGRLGRSPVVFLPALVDLCRCYQSVLQQGLDQLVQRLAAHRCSDSPGAGVERCSQRAPFALFYARFSSCQAKLRAELPLPPVRVRVIGSVSRQSGFLKESLGSGLKPRGCGERACFRGNGTLNTASGKLRMGS